MTIGLVGKKIGMTRVFNEEGKSIPVSVVQCQSWITCIKSVASDGYDAVQVAYGKAKPKNISRPVKGQFVKAGVEPCANLSEFRCSSDELSDVKVGDMLSTEIFEVGQKIDVSGISKGKGFAGVIKRHNFSMQDATHGNSLSHRAHGSTGQCQTPGKVHKGKKMAGQMGNKKCTIQSLEVVSIKPESNLVLIKGAIPGAPGGYVVLKSSVKHIKKGEG